MSSTSVRLLAPGTSRPQVSAAIRGGNPSLTGAFGLARIFEQLADEGQRAVINRVDEARPDRHRQRTVGHEGRVACRFAEGIEVAALERVVDPSEMVSLSYHDGLVLAPPIRKDSL